MYIAGITQLQTNKLFTSFNNVTPHTFKCYGQKIQDIHFQMLFTIIEALRFNRLKMLQASLVAESSAMENTVPSQHLKDLSSHFTYGIKP